MGRRERMKRGNGMEDREERSKGMEIRIVDVFKREGNETGPIPLAIH